MASRPILLELAGCAGGGGNGGGDDGGSSSPWSPAGGSTLSSSSGTGSGTGGSIPILFYRQTSTHTDGKNKERYK